jgi:hypothetical protein
MAEWTWRKSETNLNKYSYNIMEHNLPNLQKYMVELSICVFLKMLNYTYIFLCYTSIVIKLLIYTSKYKCQILICNMTR